MMGQPLNIGLPQDSRLDYGTDDKPDEDSLALSSQWDRPIQCHT